MSKLVQTIDTYLPKSRRNMYIKRVAVFLLIVNMLLALPVALERTTFADDVIVGSAAYANTIAESENIDNGDTLASSSDAEPALNNIAIDDSSDVSESDALIPVSSSDENNAMPAADFGELKIIIKTTPEAVGKDLNFSFSGYGTMYADFGDGNIVECGFDNISKGTVIKVYSTGDITTMYCYEKEVIELDVSRCKSLEELYCGGDGMRTGKLNELNASGCASLKTLECFDCELTSLDVSDCVNLVSIDCSEALLESIDLSGCNSLEKLVCDDNNLEILDVSDCSNLLSLSCDYNNLSKIDVSKNINLKSLSCFNNNLTEIDVSKNAALSSLDCGGNKLTEIDVSKNAALSSLGCDENNLTEIDVSQNINLKSLSCDSNNLTKVDVSKNAALTDLNVAYNKLTEVNVADNSELQWLFCDGNGLTELDISKNTKLYYLSFAENNLTEIDLSNQKSLEMLYCDSNNLTELTVYSDLMIDASGAKNCFRFSTMPIEFPEWDWIGGGSLTHRYAPQQDIKIASQIKEDEAIDLSSEYDINGTKTVYTWYDAADDSVIPPTTANNGVFTFGEKYAGKKVYCQMTNDLFPYLTLKTTVVTVGSAQVPDTSFEVDDNTSEDAVVDAEPSEKFSCVDENNNLVDVSGLKLIVGNVAENSKKAVADAIAKYNKQFDVEQNNYAMYDISLVDAKSGAKVEITEGKIKITLKVPDNFPGQNKGYTFNLYHYKDNGAVEEIPITFNNDGNSYYFYADDFSPYVLIWTEKTSGGSSTTDGDKSPTTGEDIYKNYAVLAVLLNLMLASMTVMWFVYDRHKEFFVSKANLVAAKAASKEADASVNCSVGDETDSAE